MADWEPEQDRGGNARGGGSRSPQRLAEYDRLRQGCPVAWADDLSGHWTLTRFADVAEAARKPGTFESGEFFILPIPEGGRQIPITLNPPEHTVFRRMLNRYFTKERMDGLEPLIRSYAREHLAPILRAGGGDVVPALCQVLPARTLAALMNLPDAASDELLAQIASFEKMGWDPEKVAPVIFGVFASYIGQLVAERRKQPLDPDLDLISGAMAMELDGAPLPDEDVIGIGTQMIAAGHATSADALGGAIYRLATNPDVQMRLRRQPELIPTAVEEFLRLETPLPELGRRATEDVELHGRTIRAGELVALNYAAANRDPEAFEHPESCIIDRSPNRHLSFGSGMHKCLGAPLARLELRVVLEELLAATTEISLGGATEETPGLILAGFTTLPIRVKLVSPARS
ncbi:MAG TPA: cytochrome P450 [Streptomyces sp.]|uniref:cytochrome P450 n=1 Tax=Streptomyces sp. TaxID=1931 RepID=UPI002CC225FD|nr:cytochrome P450 [Streptomyces sp.]HWU09290.1 cytochrome P450 [Streptomyces sp.]